MDTKELCAALTQAGWSFGASSVNSGVSWYAYRRLIGAKDCACNDKPPTLVIQPYEFRIDDMTHCSVQIEIRGQLSNGHLVEFTVYGVKYDEVLPKMDEFKNILKTAWDAVA